jgi:ABC-2 type transport system permease protein
MLPFQTQAHVPLSIYVGRMSGDEALQGLVLQALWAVALYGLTVVVWRSAMNKVVVQGG